MYAPSVNDFIGEDDLWFQHSEVIDKAYLLHYVLSMLSLHRAKPEDVLCHYEREDKFWTIPAPYGLVGDVYQWFRLPSRLSRHQVQELEQKWRAKIGRHTLRTEYRRELCQNFGRMAYTPAIFSNAPAHLSACDLFSAELALATGAYPGRLLYQGHNIHRVLTVHGTAGTYIGLHSHRHRNVDVEGIKAYLETPRYATLVRRYDIFNRCRAWGRFNLSKFQLGSFERALSLMKLTKNVELAFQLEDAVERIETFQIEEDRLLPIDSLFTEDILNHIRALWYESECIPEVALRYLYDYVCPQYLDHSEFSTMFGKDMISKELLSPEDIDRINKGFDKFNGWFLKCQKEGRIIRRDRWITNK